MRELRAPLSWVPVQLPRTVAWVERSELQARLLGRRDEQQVLAGRRRGEEDVQVVGWVPELLVW